MESASAPRRRTLHPLGRLPGGIPALPPRFIEPCLATPHESSPAGEEWIHELKYEGARTQARVIDGKAVLYSREGLDCSKTFASIAQALQMLAARNAILDGEIVVLDSEGSRASMTCSAASARRILLRSIFFGSMGPTSDRRP